MTAKKNDRISKEMVEMAALWNRHEILSAHDLDRVKALASTPPVYTLGLAKLILGNCVASVSR